MLRASVTSLGRLRGIPSLRPGRGLPPLRTYLTYFGEDMDERERNLRVAEYAEDVVFMGAEEYPGYRKERLRGKDRRKMMAERTESKRASRKVNSLIDFLEYRRHVYKQVKGDRE